MTQLNAYLIFDGNCADAMRFYQKTLGGKLDIITQAESPMADQTPPGSENRIMHARLSLDGGVLMASDAQVGPRYEGMGGFSLSLTVDTAAEARKLFSALSAGGKVTWPIDKSFWAEAFGIMEDKFGVTWMVNGAPNQQ
ncbi:MAG: VOC family protein [Gemmatimonadota bacterium]